MVQLIFISILATITLLGSAAQAQGQLLFVSHPNQIIALEDVNEDGDFFDFSEKRVYADGLPAVLGALADRDGKLFVVAPASATIYVLQDLNEDGDALDFGEVLMYAKLPGTSSQAAGMAVEADGSLLVAETVSNTLYRIHDLNSDGDAMDFDEVVPVASGFSAPKAIAVRPDGKVLVSQQLSSMPVRILFDRNADGGFFDFAENLSYVESSETGSDIEVVSNERAFVTRSASGTIALLQDRTGDDDALDFDEIITYAQGMQAAAALTADGQGGFYVAGQDTAGSVYQVRDLNGDDDALDFAEVVIVANGITNMNGIRRVATVSGPCVLGDVNGDGIVSVADVNLFVSAVVGLQAADACRVDVNGDTAIDGRDIQPFVEIILP